MKVYTVHEQAAPAADRLDRAEHLEFVADGFDWQAALFAPFMLAGYQLWVGLAIYAVALATLMALLRGLGASPAWIGLAIAALHVFVGFEFHELRRATLDAAGWANLGTVTGRTRYDCERRFMDDWLPRQPLLSGLRSPRDSAPQASDLPAVAQPTKLPRWPWSR